MRNCILAAASDYGPFAPLVGYVFALVSTAAMLGFLVRGPMKNWEIPEQEGPQFLNHLSKVLVILLVVGGWLLAVPGRTGLVYAIASACIVAGIGFGLRYARILRLYRYNKEVATSSTTTQGIPILGGDDLTPAARAEIQKRGISVQEFLEGTAYEPDLVWPREARTRVYQRATLAFILSVALVTSGVSWLGFAVQVTLTGKPAAAVIKPEQAPGIERIKIPDKPPGE